MEIFCGAGGFGLGFGVGFFITGLGLGGAGLGAGFLTTGLGLGGVGLGTGFCTTGFGGVGRTCGTCRRRKWRASSKTCMTSGFCSQLGINPYTSRPKAKAIWQISATRKIRPSLWFIPNIIFYPAPIITIPRHHHLDDNALELAGR